MRRRSSIRPRRGSSRTAAFASRRDRLTRRVATAASSPRRPRLLPRHLDFAEELDLVDELDAELLTRATARLAHQRERVGRSRAVGVLDEVRVARRDLGAPDPVAAEAARLEHPPGGKLVFRVLEHAAER